MNLSHDDLGDFLRFCARADVVSPLQTRSAAIQSPSHTPAAVLIGMAPDDAGAWHILMTRRAETLRRHTGQIAFAGGKCDPNDRNPIATALRETLEETDVAPDVWRVSGCLKPCYTPSGFAITPVLAWTDTLPETHANPQEVAEIFWLPLDFALDLSRYTQRENLPALPYLRHDIWGATALMLHHLAVCWSAYSANICVKRADNSGNLCG